MLHRFFRFPTLWIFILLGGVLLVACNGESGQEDNEDNNSRNRSSSLKVTLDPMPTHNVISACTQTELDEWIDEAYFRIDQFILSSRPIARSASDDNRVEANQTLRNLVIQRDELALVATPACVEPYVTPILSDMQAVIAEFQRFVNAETDAEEFGNNTLPIIRTMEEQFNRIEQETAIFWKMTPTSSN